MLFHADRNVKENMFQFLKREAEDHLAKKNENKNLKRNEERMRIESIMQKEREEQERKRMQKIKHMNDMMSEYNNMISKKGEDRSLRKNKFEDIKINSYGVSSNKNNNEMREFENIPNNINSNAFVVPNDLNSQVEYMNSHLNNTGSNNILFNYLIGFNIKADTHINPITHKNINNYDEFVRNKKYEQQKTYKEVLDSQVL